MRHLCIWRAFLHSFYRRTMAPVFFESVGQMARMFVMQVACRFFDAAAIA